jgi:hypothetical protein
LVALGTTSAKVKGKKKLFEQAIDQIVISQADDDSVWEKPVHVRRRKSISVEK